MNSANPTKDYLDVVTRAIHHSRLRILNPAERYLNRVASLPPAPVLVTELLTLFREPDRDVDQVVQLISYEPSLTAQILRTCNSAFFAGEQPPGDIFEAVSRLGFYQVYCLVVSIFGAKARSMEGADQ
jgi:HD-like signal output (HDOD) protein